MNTSERQEKRRRGWKISRLVLATFMVSVGVLHFITPEPFVRIVPRALPAPLVLVYVSGACEILGGGGLVVERTRRAAAWGLIALFIAVFPANVNMAVNDIQPDGATMPQALLWLRLPLQLVLIGWAYSFACARRPNLAVPASGASA